MTKVAVLGASGRTGRFVVEEVAVRPDLRLVAAVARAGTGTVPIEAGCFADADVVIDFSLPEALQAAIPFLGGRALVTGTTGVPADVQAALDAHATRAPLVQAANFSLGVAGLAELVRRASDLFPDADIEIVELHHRRKRDAPSGTASMLARAAATHGRAREVHGRTGLVGERPRDEIGVHAVRGGDVVGEHTVWLLMEGERIALSHHASSRATFARGAVRAAQFVAGRPPGRYSLPAVLGL